MLQSRLVQISRYLSQHLRHTPDRLGLSLQSGGWVAIEDLLTASTADGFPISRAELEMVVAQSEKQRFALDVTGTLIRANQGHSVAVELNLEPQTPPDWLYHGTHELVLGKIQQEGLQKMSRHHVHLSADPETARRVGLRRGRPVVLTIDAAAMYQEGFIFYHSQNGVWLVDSVPPSYLTGVE